MQPKTKSILLISSVLIIGIIIGAIGSTLLTKNMWKERVSRFRTPEGFTERILDRIDPDPDKRDAVEKILLEQHQQLTKKFENTRMEMKAHVDSVLQKLKPLLNEEQMERATKILKRRPPRPDRGKEHFRRPPDHE
jgi:hypothetical protein